MKMEAYLSRNIKDALQKDPPGEWMFELPDACIRLNSGFPAPDLVPADKLKEAVTHLIDEEGDLPLHYVGSPRFAGLKDSIQQRLAERGIQDGEVLITSGACQGIDLIARVFIDDQTLVAVESPTYMEALEVFQNYTGQFMSIPVDEHGLQTDRFEEVLAKRKKDGLPMPRVLYTIPTFQNPTGTTMTIERRKHVLELAEKYDFLIIEDDAYGELYFREQSVPLKAIDHHERVLYVGSLSKVVAPGMRIGWVNAPAEVTTALAWFKKDLDHPFVQATMASFLEKNDMEKRLHMLRATYQEKRNAMTSALKENMPSSVSWHIPEGGYFVWVEVKGADTSKLLPYAMDEGVAYVPGQYFFLNQADGKAFLRLSFSYASRDEIVDGVRKLGKAMRKFDL
ncbi:aminotransferase-like domain-containing protein [Virgibacillus siamensis]|uniref:aminotransferase-like domain-containing protein n=1 Tax=Virgibacillus siamensis TaxID=480071 RepID=UPI001588E154|nr:PLP-dependent aminotransferase family protein [Virgibacillus siamensis]